MSTTRTLATAYDARIAKLSALLKLRTEWERRTERDRLQALIDNAKR